MASPEKKRRRSSFAPGRINILQTTGVGTVTELYKAVDNQLPQEERLAMLSKLCFQYTLDKMKEEMTEIEDFESFKSEAEDAVMNVMENMEQTNVFKTACFKERYLPNPVNIEMDEAIKDLEGYRNKLQAEADKWDELLKTTDDKLLEAESKLEVKEICESGLPSSLKTEAAGYLCNSRDYNQMMLDLERTEKSIALHIDDCTEKVNLVQRVQETADQIISHKTKVLKKVSRGENSPRKLVESIMSLSEPDISQRQSEPDV